MIHDDDEAPHAHKSDIDAPPSDVKQGFLHMLNTMVASRAMNGDEARHRRIASAHLGIDDEALHRLCALENSVCRSNHGGREEFLRNDHPRLIEQELHAKYKMGQYEAHQRRDGLSLNAQYNEAL